MADVREQQPARRHVTRRWLGGGLLAAAASTSLPAVARAAAHPRPPLAIADWLHLPTEAPFRVPLDYVGLHADDGQRTSVPPPDYPYDAVRSLEVADAKAWPVTQWAVIERQPGAFHWAGVDAWVGATTGKTRIWVLFGTPAFYQKYPGEPWRYPYLPGGGSPPREPEAAARFIRALLARYPGEFRFVEIWNEPNFGWGPGGAGGRWSPTMGKPGFFTGTAEDLAGMARTVRAVLPPGVALMGCAWETQYQGRTAANGLIRFSRAGDGAGGVGRDHIDALSVHAYTFRNDPNTLIGELRGYIDRFRDAGYSPGTPRYVSEAGAEAPVAWTRDTPPLPDKIRNVKRWLLIPAALGYSAVYLYKHSNLSTLGDPAREPALGRAITEAREALRGRLLVAAARLADDTIWLAFADGTTTRA